MKFGTKAQTLDRLRSTFRGAVIPDLLYIEVDAWRHEPDDVLEAVAERFGATVLAVRSSALGEDSPTSSMAGAYTSVLGVKADDKHALSQAIREVLSSYSGNPRDQVLFQPMIQDLAVSGVITTHVLDTGAPYYVLNYDDESGRPDTITGGTGVNKTVLLHRSTREELVESPRVQRWITMTRELEATFGDIPLDIEFAEGSDGTLYLFQVRPISVERNWNRAISRRVDQSQEFVEAYIVGLSRRRPGVLGARTVLGEMPDWNPAEMIGRSPRPLAISLYKYLITDRVWAEARAGMGYRRVEDESLMVVIGGRPYIDVRNSFNSFLPAGLRDDVGEKLVDAWLDRLDAHPELHDKVEFDVAQTCSYFDFDTDFRDRYADRLDPHELSEFRGALQQLTRTCLDPQTSGLAEALAAAADLERRQRRRQRERSDGDVLEIAFQLRALLNECRALGTRPFSVVARHAFMAETLLRSAARRGALAPDRLDAFRQSLVTVLREMSEDLHRVCEGTKSTRDFLERYGHLRPGTYDILSPRYDRRPDLFDECHLPDCARAIRPFELEEAERRALDDLLEEAGLGVVDAEGLLGYAREAIVGREYAKAVFTRNVSDALELIAHFGDCTGFSRDEMSFVPVDFYLDHLDAPVLENLERRLRDVVEEGRSALALSRSLSLGYLVRDARDVYVIPLHRGVPNFVTSKRVEGRPVLLDSRAQSAPPLFGRIACIENADPGFDWIFTRGIAGLVTQYGGSNSHMAIRCAEFDLPAAIGCGSQTFDRLVKAGRIALDCSARKVRPVYAG